MDLTSLMNCLHGGLIVSCQALPDEPLYGSSHMAAMAHAAVQAGAVAIRANGPEDIAAIHSEVQVPIIGLFKVDLPGVEVRITPSLRQALQVAAAGADIIAVDATARPHPEGNAADLIDQVHRHTNRPVLADVSTVEEGLSAISAGAEFVATTLSGYTRSSPAQAGPDFALLEQLVKALSPRRVPVIAEGRISTPEEALKALELGAHAVVVGSAICRPQWITARFVAAIQKRNSA